MFLKQFQQGEPTKQRTIRAPLSKTSSSSGSRQQQRRRHHHAFGPAGLVAVVRGTVGLVATLFVVAELGVLYYAKRKADDRPPADAPEPRGLESSADRSSSSSLTYHHHHNGTREFLVLITELGYIRIALRPDLSKESVDYIHRVLKASEPDGSCPDCRLYRAEKPSILQGVLREDVEPNAVRGPCPAGYEYVPNECPEWDEHCGCHGPVMTRGMVGWAAGTPGGPDFFISSHPYPANWWGTQHTVWGEVRDADSFAVIDQVWTLPTEEQDGLTFLQEPIPFTIEMV